MPACANHETCTSTSGEKVRPWLYDTRDAWPNYPFKGVSDELTIGVGTTDEVGYPSFVIRFTQFGPVLEATSDSWIALATTGIVDHLAGLPDEIDVVELRDALVSLGFVDRTDEVCAPSAVPAPSRRVPAALDLARFASGRQFQSPVDVALHITGLREDCGGTLAAITDATLALWQNEPGVAVYETTTGFGGQRPAPSPAQRTGRPHSDAASNRPAVRTTSTPTILGSASTTTLNSTFPTGRGPGTSPNTNSASYSPRSRCTSRADSTTASTTG